MKKIILLFSATLFILLSCSKNTDKDFIESFPLKLSLDTIVVTQSEAYNAQGVIPFDDFIQCPFGDVSLGSIDISNFPTSDQLSIITNKPYPYDSLVVESNMNAYIVRINPEPPPNSLVINYERVTYDYINIEIVDDHLLIKPINPKPPRDTNRVYGQLDEFGIALETIGSEVIFTQKIFKEGDKYIASFVGLLPKNLGLAPFAHYLSLNLSDVTFHEREERSILLVESR